MRGKPGLDVPHLGISKSRLPRQLIVTTDSTNMKDLCHPVIPDF